MPSREDRARVAAMAADCIRQLKETTSKRKRPEYAYGSPPVDADGLTLAMRERMER